MYKIVKCFFIVLLLEIYIEDWESEKVKDGWVCTHTLSLSLSHTHTHTHTQRSQCTNLRRNLFCLSLCSLLSWHWYRVTTRHQIVLISPRFSTLSSLAQGQSSKRFDVKSLPFQVFYSPLVSGYIIFRTTTQILMITPPVCRLRVARGYIYF